ncbi:hypothetical protein NEA10_18375 [Phormidium yuhuli AB48]|uniref:Uncharacterized protein n=1 Tax=Phormidium yuhuli AB48 TaxID=2940671 RepID=A0ABY5AQX9_9CYAN|nr:hypothetical protein [Phormidium yuhuli]USR90761.1 hypothetical protein NEA10_18375 [Phormidium yuhuli AB48]
MSLIHLEKSVLTFHFKEILEGGDDSHPLTWLGLGVLVFGSPLLPLVSQTRPRRPTPSRARVREGISLSEWIAQAQQQSQLASEFLPTDLSQRAGRSPQGNASSQVQPMSHISS